MTARPAMPRVLRSPGPPPRRGVLLLVVLSMLTLFLMLGAAYIVSATRAKEAARAHARLTFGGDEARVPHARITDMVLLKVLRGGTASPPTSPAAPLQLAFESLLADKYGQETLVADVAVTAPALGVTVPPPVLTVSATLVGSTARPTDLNGRLLAFTAPGRPATTHRILRSRLQGSSANTAGTAFTLAVDAPRRLGPWARPLAGRAIINGREFAGGGGAVNEGWDGFDAANPFLAQVGPGATIASSTVSRISFHPGLSGPALVTALESSSNSIPNGADNDNDGALDGLFMDFDIPDVTDAHGNVVNVRASVLVVDLDGRFNVNAHGSLAPLVYSGTHPGWTTDSAVGGPLNNAPMGSGYGPAEISANLGTGNEPRSGSNVRTASPRLFDSESIRDDSVNFRMSENPKLLLLTGASFFESGTSNAGVPRQRGVRANQSRYQTVVDGTNPNPTPRLRPLEGKYGWRAASGWLSGSATLSEAASFRYARPGQATVDDAASRINDRRAAATAGDQVNYGIPRLWWTGTTFDWGTAAATRPLPRGIYNSPPDLHGRMKTLTLAATGSAIVPQVAFAQPEWSSTTDARESKDDPYELRLDTRAGFGGWLHDPMTDGLDEGVFNHNPFTPAELEPVLRPYDIDTNRLPPRLAAMLGSAAEESRLKVTTDSWDTTAITGSAAMVLFGTASGGTSGWLQRLAGNVYGTGPSAAVSGAIGGEVSRGEKFDLNRPLVASGTAIGTGTTNAGYLATSEYVVQRQAYFKDLYTLLVALATGTGAPLPAGQTAALAQWAANVVEFRDADSRVIPFEYDENPQNGWQDDDGNIATAGSERKVVWGVERPEILIREAFAWRNTATGSAGMSIALHRPWNAKAYATGSTNLIDAEPCDYALDELSTSTPRFPTNQIDLGKKAHAGVLAPGTNALYNNVSGTSYPIWRLRLAAGGSTAYVRLDSGSAAPGEFVLAPAITNGAGKPKMPPDSTLTLVSGTLVLTGSGATSGTARLDISGSNRTVAGLQMPSTATTGTVYLERLSDPSAAPTASQWSANPDSGADTATDPQRYLVVDQTEIDVVNTATVPVAATSRKRLTTDPSQAFWRPPATDLLVSGSVQNNSSHQFPSTLATGSTAWLPWPNRPFTSAAELLLVPQGKAVEILQNYRRLTPAESGTIGLGKGAPIPLSLLFDAVHVPTRFAGIHTTTGTAADADLAAAGIYSGTSQSPAATVTANQLSSWREPGRVNLNTVVAEDVWNAVVAGPLPQTVRSSTVAALRTIPAQGLGHALALSGGSETVISDTTSPGLAAHLNPLHEIYTATRLANTVTPRSNVFGIWITIRESVANDPDSVRYRRAFYIVDRSIPVGFEDGRDHNVWDCVRLRRIIE
jgi:hypothetical protein